MNARPVCRKASLLALPVVACLIVGGCHGSAPPANDATLNTQLQARLFADQSLSGQSIQTAVQNGVATLNGTVTSDAARSQASADAGQIAGIKTVVNNLVTQAPAVAASAQVPVPMPPPPPMSTKQKKPSAAMAMEMPPQPAPIVRSEPQQQQQQPTPQQAPPQQPQPPAIHMVTLPAGTSIPVRITQTLDSATTQTGDRFTGTIASDIVQDGVVVLAQGTPVSGHVDAAQDAAHFKGSSLLTISLSSIERHGDRIQVATEPYSRQGEGRGKNTAEKVGGGAAVGAILGGIFGGGKGAAIGAAAGGGVGAGANTVTRGQQVQIASETVVRFRLTEGVVVHVSSGDRNGGDSGEGLERRSDQ